MHVTHSQNSWLIIDRCHVSVLPFHNVSASSWCSLGWPNFPDPPDDHLIALETNATLSGEFGSIRLKSLVKCSRTQTKNVITQLKSHHVTSTDEKNPRRFEKYFYIGLSNIGYLSYYVLLCLQYKINQYCQYFAGFNFAIKYCHSCK